MDPIIELELAKPAESLALAEMSRNLIEQGLRPRWKPSRILAAIQDPETVVLVAQTRLGIGGFAVMEFQDIHAHLNLIAVKPGNQRTGIGKALLAWLEDSARVAGIEGLLRRQGRCVADGSRTDGAGRCSTKTLTPRSGAGSRFAKHSASSGSLVLKSQASVLILAP
jgi:ribosomal protein S18 acetylase RimI-like enzyme